MFGVGTRNRVFVSLLNRVVIVVEQLLQCSSGHRSIRSELVGTRDLGHFAKVDAVRYDLLIELSNQYPTHSVFTIYHLWHRTLDRFQRSFHLYEKIFAKLL